MRGLRLSQFCRFRLMGHGRPVLTDALDVDFLVAWLSLIGACAAGAKAKAREEEEALEAMAWLRSWRRLVQVVVDMDTQAKTRLGQNRIACMQSIVSIPRLPHIVELAQRHFTLRVGLSSAPVFRKQHVGRALGLGAWSGLHRLRTWVELNKSKLDGE